MTAEEFKAWTEETASSKYHWKSDPIQASLGRYLFYMGGQDGKFIEIDRDGKVTVGTYEGAIPHIGEACFFVKFTKQFESKEKALQRVLECGGIKFLLDVTGQPVYTA